MSTDENEDRKWRERHYRDSEPEADPKAQDKLEAEQRQQVREALRDPETQATIHGLQEMALELSQGAIRDPAIMEQWKEIFPDMCPGCFGLHSMKIPFIKGLCTGCRLKLSKAQKQLSTQE